MNKLQERFPLLRTKEELLTQIHKDPYLSAVFYEWNSERQSDFLDRCSGVKGMKMTYDSFFKEAFDPEFDPSRLEEFLSLLLKRTVNIKSVLPTNSIRLGDETSTVIMDIVVEFNDGSIANIEIQKVGYYFPGPRSACYSADLLLRQYKRIRDIRKREKREFKYTDIQSVYTIVLFDKSPAAFKNYPNTWIHTFSQQSDTGLELELLQKYIFIPLDIFKVAQQNIDKSLDDKLQAWLTFICRDEPEIIVKLLDRWPDFQNMYDRVYSMCRNMEDVMGIFSEELLELDKMAFRTMMEDFREEAETNKAKAEAYKAEAEASKAEAEASKAEAEASKAEAEASKAEAEASKAEADVFKERAEFAGRLLQKYIEEGNQDPVLTEQIKAFLNK